MSSAAFAATTDQGAKPPTIAEIVVTAQFHEQKLQDTPIAITAVDAATLEQRGQTSVADIAMDAPNVTLTPMGASFGPSMGASIRGIGQFDFNPAYEPGVGLYVDDVYYPTLTGSDLDLLDLERVEILRGPQGTLTGRNSIGGAIKLFSKKPDQTNSGFLEAGYGSRERIDLNGAANFAINDQLAMRISGTMKKQDGYINRLDYGCLNPNSGVAAVQSTGNCLVGKDGAVNSQGLRAAIRWRPNSRVDLTVSADYTHSDAPSGAEVLTYANDTNPNAAAAPGVPYDSRFICGKFCNYTANAQPAAAWIPVIPAFGGYPLNATRGSANQVFDGKGVSANLNLEISDRFNVQSISAYREYTSSFNSDDDLSPANVGYGMNALKHHFASEELHLNGTLTDHLKFTLGGFASDQKTTYYTYQDIRYAVVPLQFIGNDPVTANSQAAFATAFWNPIEALNVTAGVRYTKEAKDYTFVRSNPDGSYNPILGGLNGYTGHYTGDHVDYRVSIDYRWNKNLMTYATISTGFKGGGINPRPFYADQAAPFGTEELTAYEIGAKTDTFDGRLRANVSAFYNQYSKIQIPLNYCPQFVHPAPCGAPENVGDADVKGVELEANAILAKGWTADASLSYIDFKFTKIDPNTGLNLNDQQGMLPKFKFTIGTQYVFDLGAAGSLTPRVDVAYQDSEWAGVTNNAANYANFSDPNVYKNLYIPSYALANARITWRNASHDLEASLQVNNLTDKYYYTGKFGLIGAGAAGFVKSSVGRPREFVFSVKKSF